ncbi:MAG TPA: hypothetical protein ENI87_05310 [bacterium]|nr:hypothetical protein [bacterium]
MNDRRSLLPLALLFGAGAVAQDAMPAKIDARSELAKASARAKVHNKRVLVVLDTDGRRLADRLQHTGSVARPLLYEFETVAVAKDEAAAIAVHMHLPADRAGLAVLAADGGLRAWLAAETFAVGDRIDGKRLLQMLEPHFCAPVDAEQKLADALRAAKKSGRNVFVRFDAPW